MDNILEWLKWPTSFLAFMLLPGTLLSAWTVISGILENPLPALPLIAGVGVYAIIWKLVFSRQQGTWFSTLEHELTVFFCITNLPSSDWFQSNLQSRWPHEVRRKGNWLISISPYFFPTFSVVLLVILSLLPSDKLTISSTILGVSIGYHIISNINQLHGGQTDLHKVGRLFALLFLPTANIICYAGILAFAYGGVQRLAKFFEGILQISTDYALIVIGLFQT